MTDLETWQMKVMIAAASKHGGTWEIAEAVAEALSGRGLTTSLCRLDPDEDYPDPSGHDAFVIGSAVYAGHWMASARGFLADYQALLLTRPVWLFSSGPVGIVPRPSAADAVNVDAFMQHTHAREHHLFGGRIDRSHLGFAERALVSALGVSDGDNRDFADVATWSAGIAEQLAHQPVLTAPR